MILKDYFERIDREKKAEEAAGPNDFYVKGGNLYLNRKHVFEKIHNVRISAASFGNSVFPSFRFHLFVVKPEFVTTIYFHYGLDDLENLDWWNSQNGGAFSLSAFEFEKGEEMIENLRVFVIRELTGERIKEEILKAEAFIANNNLEKC